MLLSTFLILIFSANLVKCVVYEVDTAFNVELQSAFPANAFNSSCVSSSCPNLNSRSICSTPGSSYDLKDTFKCISECAGGIVCDLQIEPRPILFIQFSLSQMLQSVPLTGACNSTPNCVYANVIPTFTVISANKVAMSLPNLKFYGNLSCDISQSDTSQLLTLGLPLLSIIALPAPTVNVAYDYTFNYSSTIEINSDNSVEVDNSRFEVTGVNFDGLQFPSVPGIPNNFFDTFKALVVKALGRMSLTSYLGDFYQNLVESALQVAADKCDN